MTLIHESNLTLSSTSQKKAGLRSSFNEITRDLKSYALHLCKNESDANDLFQDTSLKIFINAEKFEQIENFKAWAVTIMRNIFIKNYHQKNRRREIIELAPKIYFFNSARIQTKNEGEGLMAYNELQRLIYALPEIYQRPFLMVCKGFKYIEIAEQLNMPLKTIKNRIRLARRKLKVSHAVLVGNRA